MPWQLLTYGFLHDPATSPTSPSTCWRWSCSARRWNTWGPRRYLTYYLTAGAGAGLCQLLVTSWMAASTGDVGSTVGASGGVFGLLLAYGMLFPNQRVMLLIPPIPMRARTLVILYGLFELMLGFTGLQPGWPTSRTWRDAVRLAADPLLARAAAVRARRGPRCGGPLAARRRRGRLGKDLDPVFRLALHRAAGLACECRREGGLLHDRPLAPSDRAGARPAGCGVVPRHR